MPIPKVFIIESCGNQIVQCNSTYISILQCCEVFASESLTIETIDVMMKV